MPPQQAETIPVQKLLEKYGKAQLQLEVAQEKIVEQQQQINSLATQLQSALSENAELKKAADDAAKEPAFQEKEQFPV